MRKGIRIDDRFEVEGFHASGGMGVVYRARDLATGAPVALKVVEVVSAGDAARFEREADALAQMTHPGIVRYIAHGRTPAGEHYLVEEWVDGALLSRHLAAIGLSLGESVTLVRKVAEALAEAHAAGIVHRDIKPSNLILAGGDAEQPRILDFGVARLIDPEVRLTRTGTVVGTPGYMAPEQALGRSDIGARADVFSLGCILYYCLSGCPAFAGSDLTAVRTKMLLCEPTPLELACPEAPPALAELVHRMIARVEASRPADAGAVADELGRIAISPAAASARRVRALEAPTQIIPSVVTMVTGPNMRDGDQFISLVMVRDAPTAGDEPGPAGERLHQLTEAATRLGASFEAIDARGLVACMGGAPVETAIRAARAALLFATAMPMAGVAIGSGVAAELAALIDVSAAALERAVVDVLFTPGEPQIRIDALTAELLDGRFPVHRVRDSLILGPPALPGAGGST